MITQAMRQMPQYVCHKTVHAIRIDSIQNDAGGFSIIKSGKPGEGYEVQVGFAWMEKHKPEVGGYYVVYADGYTSYSPQKAFDDGYKPTKAGA